LVVKLSSSIAVVVSVSLLVSDAKDGNLLSADVKPREGVV
jgi:hypothetical protein